HAPPTIDSPSTFPARHSIAESPSGHDRTPPNGHASSCPHCAGHFGQPTHRDRTRVNLPVLFSLADRVALVTGGSSGIGRAIAEAFAEAGARVVLVARSEQALSGARDRIVTAGGRAEFVPCDLADRGEIVRCAEDAARPFGPPDIVVNGAGLNVRKPMLELTTDDWDRTMRVNLEAPFFLS